MRPRGVALAALGLGAAALLAAPDERALAYGRAARSLSRLLVLVAARDGSEAARRLGGPHLPERIALALEKAAATPAAGDLRAMAQDQPELQGPLVLAVIEGLPELERALVELEELGGARLAQELTALERECRRLQGAAATLERNAKAGSIPSRLAARNLEAGPQLLLLARGAPLLQADLGQARTQLQRYEVLARVLGRSTDGWARALLDLGPRAAESAKRELLASGDAGQVATFAVEAELRLSGAVEALGDAIARSVAGATRIREEELVRTLAGARGAEQAESLVLLQAYRTQFGEPPDLEAQPAWDVYADRRGGRLHFWLEGEQRWERGGERVDPLQPAIDALLAARDPGLRRLACESRALWRLYGAFEPPLVDGLAELSGAGEAVLGATARIEGLGREHGLPPDELAQALERRTGAAQELLGPAEGQLAALRDRALAAAIARGPEGARDLLRVLQAAARELAGLEVRVVPVAIEGPGGALADGTPVDLVWTPDPAREPGAWLLPPPSRARASRIAVVLAGPAGGPLAGEVRGFALAGEQVLMGRASLGGEAGTALRLAPAAGPALVEVPGPGGTRLVRQLPADGAALRVWRTAPGARRPLRPVGLAEGWGWALESAPGEAGGRWTLAAEDAAGKAQATLEVELRARPAVVVEAPELAPVTTGAVVRARLEGGAAGPREWTIETEAGVPRAVVQGDATLEWELQGLDPGRYRIATAGADPAPLAVSTTAPRVVACLDPWSAASVAAVHTAQGVCLRLEAWPVLAPEELLRVEWTIAGGAREQRAETWPVPGAPWAATVLPLRIGPRARPGERTVLVRAHTLRGVLEASGRFEVVAGGARLALELKDRLGESTAALPLGGEGLVRAPRELRSVAAVLVGPQGTVRALPARFDGQVPLGLAEGDPPGIHQVWLSARTGAGEPVHGQLAVLAYRARPLELRPPAAAVLGQKARVEALAPPGYQGPFEVRAARGAWTKGLALEVVAQARNDLEVELRDRDGRRAEGRTDFAATRGEAAATGDVRYGIAADVRERRVFAVDHALLATYKKSNNLPTSWVVLEPGPLSAAAVRDRLFQTVPYDGPSDPTDAQLAYRSVSFWERLQESARARFDALEAVPGEPYGVQNSPAPGGEETLRDLTARHLADQGGWDHRLSGVRVEAEGAAPDPVQPGAPTALVRWKPFAAAGSGGGAGRVVVASPLGRLLLRPQLPATLPLGREGRAGLVVVAEREKELARPYPGGWEKLLPRALLLLEVEARLVLDGEETKLLVRRAAPDLVAVDLGLVLAALETERASCAGAPRTAERVGVRLWPLHLVPEARERRLLPAPPGALDPTPRELLLEVEARLRAAVSPGDWPAGRQRPDAVFVDSAPLLPDPGDLPRTRIVLRASWLRAARGRSAAADPGPSLGDLLAAPPEPAPAEDPAAAVTALEQAWPPAEGAPRREATQALRRAQLRLPGDPRPLALLGDLALLEGRSVEALALARWGLAQGPSPRARVVELEALLLDYRLEEARRSLAELPADLTPDLARRVAAAREQLPR